MYDQRLSAVSLVVTLFIVGKICIKCDIFLMGDLIPARAVQGEAQGIMAVPLDISGIPNNHLGYAVQWFLFALICFGMTMALAWRIRRQTD